MNAVAEDQIAKIQGVGQWLDRAWSAINDPDAVGEFVDARELVGHLKGLKKDSIKDLVAAARDRGDAVTKNMLLDGAKLNDVLAGTTPVSAVGGGHPSSVELGAKNRNALIQERPQFPKGVPLAFDWNGGRSLGLPDWKPVHTMLASGEFLAFVAPSQVPWDDVLLTGQGRVFMIPSGRDLTSCARDLQKMLRLCAPMLNQRRAAVQNKSPRIPAFLLKDRPTQSAAGAKAGV